MSSDQSGNSKLAVCTDASPAGLRHIRASRLQEGKAFQKTRKSCRRNHPDASAYTAASTAMHHTVSSRSGHRCSGRTGAVSSRRQAHLHLPALLSSLAVAAPPTYHCSRRHPEFWPWPLKHQTPHTCPTPLLAQATHKAREAGSHAGSETCDMAVKRAPRSFVL